MQQKFNFFHFNLKIILCFIFSNNLYFFLICTFYNLFIYFLFGYQALIHQCCYRKKSYILYMCVIFNIIIK